MSVQLLKMFELQNSMNAKVNADWLDLGRHFYRAAWTECAEMMDHHGWKWWKKQEPDVAQIQLELVDIWHFGLSMMIVEAVNHHMDYLRQNYKEAEIATNLTEHYAKHKEEIHNGMVRKITLDLADPNGMNTFEFGDDFLNEIENLAHYLLNQAVFPVSIFRNLVVASGMGMETDLYEQYVGKNVLNFFRQDNGYKTGEYVKIWDGREDNEHLVEIIAGLDKNDAGFADNLYDCLEARYKDVINTAA